MATRTRRAGGSKLRIEALEGRLMLSATDFVKVKVDHGTLVITGNNVANAVQVTDLGGGTYEVAGLGTTTINNSTTTTKNFSGVTKDIKVELKGGDDTFFMGDVPVLAANDPLPVPTNFVPRDLIVKMDGGSDSVGLGLLSVGRNVEVNTGNGLDDFAMVLSRVGKNLTVKGGDGGDTFGLASVSVGGEVEMKTGSSADTIGLYAVNAAKEVEVESGKGNDTVLLTLDSTAVADAFATLTDVLGILTPAELNDLLEAIALVATDSVRAKEVNVETGDGNDTVALTNVTVTKEIEVELGKGNDDLTFAANSYKKAELDGGKGVNTLTLDTTNTGKLKYEHFLPPTII